MRIGPLKPKLLKYIARHGLIKKLSKQIQLFEGNPNHVSLNTEKLEPKNLGLYSFRIDRKYRAIFHMLSPTEAEIIDISDHYQ